MLTIDERDVYRYLNDPNPSKKIKNMVKEQIEYVLKKLEPQSVFALMDIEIRDDKVYILDTNLILNSKTAISYLKDCKSVIIFTATLTSLADRLLEESFAKGLLLGTVLNAVLSAYIETYCDSTERNIKSHELLEKSYFTKRFSPGYGDLDISIQENLLNILGVSKNLGVSLNNVNIMIPNKTVSAFIGVSDVKLSYDISDECNYKCSLCNFENCIYSKT